MAKQLVGPLERNVEKLILGVVGLALLAAIALFLATSPNKIEIDGEMVGPGQIATKVYDKAEDIRGRISRARPDEEELTFEPLVDDFEEQIAAIDKAGVKEVMPSVVRFSPTVPIVDKAEKTTQDRTLVEVVPFQDPVATIGRSKFTFIDDNGQDRYVESNWATVSAIFDVRSQTEKQQLEYGPKRRDVIFMPAQLQRRKMRTNGNWSDEDWEMVEAWPSETGYGKVPGVKLVRNQDQDWEAPRDTFKIIDSFYEKLRDPVIQLNVIRPLMPDVFLGDAWKLPIITVERDVLLQDMWYLYFGQDDAPDSPENRYREVQRAAAGAGQEEQQTPEELINESKKWLRTARETCDLQAAIKAYNRALTAERHPNASRLEKGQAANLKRDANNVQDDIERGVCVPRGQGVVQEKKKEAPALQQFWVHDAKPGSIQPGQTYQYRMRPRIFNRLAAQPTMFSDPKLAETVIINGPWSTPTAPLSFPDDKFYYVIGADSRDNEVKLEFYRWFDGEWVKTRPSLQLGKPLYDEDRVELPNPNNPDEIDRPEVPFDMRGTIVDLDHKRDMKVRNQDRRGNVTFEPGPEDCVVVILDENGRLHERSVTADKNDPGRSFNNGRVFKKSSMGSR